MNKYILLPPRKLSIFCSTCQAFKEGVYFKKKEGGRYVLVYVLLVANLFLVFTLWMGLNIWSKQQIKWHTELMNAFQIIQGRINEVEKTLDKIHLGF
jgi:hypothetical protein